MVTTLLFVFGLACGSFVNALVWRTRQLDTERSKKKRKELSPLTGRSMCPHCKHELAALDLLPVLSWLQLKGKCRYCSKKISMQYPFVELLTGVLFVCSYLFWPISLVGAAWVAFGLWLCILTILIALAVYDLKWMELPNSLVAAATVIAVLYVSVQTIIGELSTHDVLLALLGGGLLFSLFYALFSVSSGRWIGGGDVKLAPVLGLLAGSPAQTLLLLFSASLIGSLIGVPLLLMQKKGRSARLKLPFGPLLIAGLLISFFFGNSLIDWYVTDFLYL